jgi:hypothetical protein
MLHVRPDIDPGSGSLILQALAGIVALPFSLRHEVGRVACAVRRTECAGHPRGLRPSTTTFDRAR